MTFSKISNRWLIKPAGIQNNNKFELILENSWHSVLPSQPCRFSRTICLHGNNKHKWLKMRYITQTTLKNFLIEHLMTCRRKYNRYLLSWGCYKNIWYHSNGIHYGREKNDAKISIFKRLSYCMSAVLISRSNKLNYKHFTRCQRFVWPSSSLHHQDVLSLQLW